MDTVYVPDLNAEQTMQLVRDLRAKGLAQGRDFNFRYNPSSQEDLFSAPKPPGAEFTFTDAKWATFFRMKYNGSS